MLELDNNTFETEVMQAEGKVIVDFYGDNCPHCAALAPHYHAFADAYGDKIKFCQLKITKDTRRLAISQRVLSMPTVAVYEGGKMVESFAGDDAAAVEAMIQKHV